MGKLNSKKGAAATAPKPATKPKKKAAAKEE